jgi:DNA-binding response OmpR family regulator
MLREESWAVSLHDARILVAEDEWVLAMSLSATLQEWGCRVVGPALRLDEALRTAEQGPIDVALLDLRLGAQRVDPLAEALRKRGVPVLLCSGCGRGDCASPALRALPLLIKPYHEDELREALEELLSARVCS